METMALEVRYEGAKDAIEVMLDRLAPLTTQEERQKVVTEVVAIMTATDEVILRRKQEDALKEAEKRTTGSWT
ncbi:hypothetical protein D9M71_776270 [compost metagenome]